MVLLMSVKIILRAPLLFTSMIDTLIRARFLLSANPFQNMCYNIDFDYWIQFKTECYRLCKQILGTLFHWFCRFSNAFDCPECKCMRVTCSIIWIQRIIHKLGWDFVHWYSWNLTMLGNLFLLQIFDYTTLQGISCVFPQTCTNN